MKGRPFVVPPHAIDARRHETHHLDAAGDHDVVSAGDDPLRGEVQRLLGGAALSIQRDSGDALGKARRQNGLAANVSRLLRDLDHAACDHILDKVRIDAGPAHEFVQHRGVKIDGMDAVERAARAASAERGANDVDYDGLAHAGPQRDCLCKSTVRFADRI